MYISNARVWLLYIQQKDAEDNEDGDEAPKKRAPKKAAEPKEKAAPKKRAPKKKKVRQLFLSGPPYIY